MALDLLKRSETGAPITQAQHDANFTAIENEVNGKTRVALNQGTVALTDATTIATDCSLGNVFTVTLGGNRTLGNPTNVVAGATYAWLITQDGTGSRTLALGSNFKLASGETFTATTTASRTDVITAIAQSSTSLLVSFKNNYT